MNNSSGLLLRGESGSLFDQLRRRKIELVKAAVNEHAFGVQHRAHCAVGYNDARIELTAKFRGPGDRRRDRQAPI